jgi:hypothetical protein
MSVLTHFDRRRVYVSRARAVQAEAAVLHLGRFRRAAEANEMSDVALVALALVGRQAIPLPYDHYIGPILTAPATSCTASARQRKT